MMWFRSSLALFPGHVGVGKCGLVSTVCLVSTVHTCMNSSIVFIYREIIQLLSWMYAEGCKDSVVSVKKHPCDNTALFDCISATNDDTTIDNTILRFISDGIRYPMISWGNSRMHKWQIPGHFSLLLYGLRMKLEVLDLKCEDRSRTSSFIPRAVHRFTYRLFQTLIETNCVVIQL